MGCQTEIAEIIVEQGADYVLLEDNQGQLLKMSTLFDDLERSGYRAYRFDYEKTVNKEHGRLEIRECWTISTLIFCAICEDLASEEMQTVSRIRSQRWVSEDKIVKTGTISLALPAPNAYGCVRSHWGIENELHWTLDIAFDEDHCRVRKDHGPEIRILRHIALNLLKQEKTCQRSIRANACWLAGGKITCSRYSPGWAKSLIKMRSPCTAPP